MLLSDYLPPYLTSTHIFTSLLNSVQPEIDNINDSIQDIINQCFVDTATWGLDNWESMLGIPSDLSKEINYRRTVVKAKLRGSGTVTVSLIQNVANSFDNGSVLTIEHPEIYSFEVKFTSVKGIPPNLSDLQYTIGQIKPAHLAVTYTFMYNVYSNFNGQYTYSQIEASGLTYSDLSTKLPAT